VLFTLRPVAAPKIAPVAAPMIALCTPIELRRCVRGAVDGRSTGGAGAVVVATASPFIVTLGDSATGADGLDDVDRGAAALVIVRDLTAERRAAGGCAAASAVLLRTALLSLTLPIARGVGRDRPATR